MPKKEWTGQQEQLLITWAEKASGYSWLHQRSTNLFKKRNLYLSVPAAVFGYVAGITILLSNDVFSDCSHIFNRQWLRGGIGIIALLAGLFSNFQEIYAFKEESEKHRMANLRFMVFFREISCVITTDPKYRAMPADFITMKRLEFDKILEQSPNIPESVIAAFNTKFHNLSIHKPDAVIGLQTILPYGKQYKIQPYRKKLSMREKMTLFRYFYSWLDACKKRKHNYDADNTLIEITNSRNSNYDSVEVDDPSISCPERNKAYLLVHGILSEQKQLIQCRNIKIRRDPTRSRSDSRSDSDLEKGQK